MSEQPNNPNTAPDAAPAPQQQATDLADLPQQEQPQAPQSATDAIREQLQATIGDAMFTPPATPAGYQFEQLNDMSQHDAALETSARAMLHAERFPAGLGRQLAQEWNRASAAELTPAQLELSTRQAEATLRQRWGEAYDRNLATVRAEVDRIAKAHPQLPLRHMLQTTSLGHSTWLAGTLLARVQARGK